MIDRMLMVTRKMTKEIERMQEKAEMLHNELDQRQGLSFETRLARELAEQLKEFRVDIDDMEHVVLAEGIR